MTGTWTVLGPGLALLVVGGLALVLRWAFGRGGSLVARPGRPGAEDDYGLLVPVAAPRSLEEGERLRRRLEGAGLRANLAQTAEGPRVLVFRQDVARALGLIEEPPPG